MVINPVISQNKDIHVVQQKFKDGSIDWEKGFIYAKGMAVAPKNAVNAGHAKMLARLGAKVDAQRRLLEIIQGIQVDSVRTMSKLMEKDIVETKVKGHLGKYAEIVKESEKWDGQTYSLMMRIPSKGINKIAVEELKKAFLQAEPKVPILKNPKYTGLVIDARGIKFRPQVIVKIIDSNGKEIYSAKNAVYKFVSQKGMVGYSSSLEKAKKDKRVKDAPFIVKAKMAAGKYNTDLVVSKESATQVFNVIKDNSEIFAKCKVIILAS